MRRNTQKSMPKSIAIIGGGIGGLTTALTLKQLGHPVTVYESASEMKPVGAGIVLANNAMQVFRKLGIQSKIEAAGNRVSLMDITDERLRTISSLDLTRFEEKYGVYNVAIHRGELQKILAAELGIDSIKLSKRLSKIERSEDFALTFEDNTIERSSILLGADGINSVVRNQLFSPSEIRDAGQVCWRGVCEMELPNAYLNGAIEAWGKGRRFGFVTIAPRKVYWYAVVSEHLAGDGRLTELFKSFHSDILDILAATSPDTIFFSKLGDLKPIIRWQDKTVCLIGDAAHATTPNMGQGACQAIEDAYTIGQLLNHGKPIEQVFSEYERLRMKKAHTIVYTSWALGKVAHLENPLGIWLRNTLMRAIPKSANYKQLEMVFDIGYL